MPRLNVGTAAGIGLVSLAGFSKGVSEPAISAAMDVAFDDPQADRAFLGRDLRPSMAVMASGVPVASQLARIRNLDRTGADIGPMGSAIGTGIFSGVGAVGGAMAGRKIGRGLRGAVMGGIAGGVVGAGLAVENVAGTAYRNRQIIGQSPFYNQSMLTAERLNASGNIVFGMHNNRRG